MFGGQWAIVRLGAAFVAGLLALLLGADARAEPVVGTTVSYGGGIGGQADERVATGLFAYATAPGGWTLGGQLDGSLEGYTGGYGCGTLPSEGAVPAVAVSCLQPGVAAHAMFGTRAAPSASTRLRLELGVGATSIFLVPGQGGDTRRATYASGLVRAVYLARLGRAFTGQWWLGLQLEERAIGVDDTRTARAVGVVLEAIALD